MTFRDFWLEYRSEVFFGLVLAALTVFSYWAAAFIPEDIFENCINPAQYVAIGIVCFYGAWVILRHQEGNRLRRLWGVTLILWGLIEVALLVVRYLFGIKAIGGVADDPLYNASLTVGNLLAWMLFVYPSFVLRPQWLTWWKAVFLAIPVILLGIVDYFLPLNLLPVIMLFPAVIFVLLCSHISNYRCWCEENFSTMDHIEVQWIVRYLIMLFLAGVSFYFICFWFVPNRMFTQQWLLFLILAYSTEQILFREDPWALTGLEETLPSNAPLPQNKNPHSFAEERILFEQWMEKDKPYLNPDFQLNDLRSVLPINRTYLSKFIKDVYGTSFYHLVSRYRLDEATRIMQENPTMKIQEIARRSGFTSPTAFSRTFLKENGKSPRSFSTLRKK